MPDFLAHALTPRELAARWRCRVTTVRAMIRAGTLSAIQIGGRTRITPEAVATAEEGPLAVRPRQRRRVDKIDPEIAKLLNG
jgi:excisionase family DNA binding protein